MNVPLTIGIVLLIIISLAIAIELNRLRSTKRRRLRASIAPPRRSPHLEKRMIAAFAGPTKIHGECFAEFSIWRQSDNTRMDVKTRGPWAVLDVFTRSLILRHLWQTLEGFVKGTILISVDAGTSRAMLWSAKETEQFNDRGVRAPWLPSTGRVGTLISGR
jgi:hypothetical protein